MSDRDKPAIIPVVKDLIDLGFNIVATSGTRNTLVDAGFEVELILKVHEGRPHVIDAIKNGAIQLIINTPSGELAKEDDRIIRRAAISYKVTTITTVAGARAAAAAMGELQQVPLEVKALQDYHLGF